jgi:DNA-binding LytR/AlgR family response regulator
MDGFELLTRIRAEERLAEIPVVLLTARAGEDSAVEGLMAGADDYVIKPFSARELVARIAGRLELTRMRRDSQRRFDALRRASWDAVYMMSADWSQMHALDGRDSLPTRTLPARAGSRNTSLPRISRTSWPRSAERSRPKTFSNSSTACAAATAPSAGPCPGPYRF